MNAHKYRAKAQTVDGIRFASKREAAVYAELKLRERIGELNSLQVQPRLDLHTVGPGGIKRKVCTHIVDFAYWDTGAKERRYLEVKGRDLPMGKLKRKWAEIEYGIEIEVRK